MPWKECHVVDERVRFVRRLLDGESMTALCEEFGIARRPATRSFSATSRSGSAASAIGAAGRIGTRISCQARSKP
jgi:hypothetical protein